MDETAVRTKTDWLNNRMKAAGERIEDAVNGGDDDDDEGEEECDEEAWNTLSRSFRQAQTVLDENRALIEEVNSNHGSKIPHNMAKNVGLICQINGNISKALSIYSDLNVNFSDVVRQRRAFASSAVNHANRGRDKVENSVDDSAAHVPEKSE